jgi:hypothetical protein
MFCRGSSTAACRSGPTHSRECAGMNRRRTLGRHCAGVPIGWRCDVRPAMHHQRMRAGNVQQAACGARRARAASHPACNQSHCVPPQRARSATPLPGHGTALARHACSRALKKSSLSSPTVVSCSHHNYADYTDYTDYAYYGDCRATRKCAPCSSKSPIRCPQCPPAQHPLSARPQRVLAGTQAPCQAALAYLRKQRQQVGGRVARGVEAAQQYLRDQRSEWSVNSNGTSLTL